MSSCIASVAPLEPDLLVRKGTDLKWVFHLHLVPSARDYKAMETDSAHVQVLQTNVSLGPHSLDCAH